MLLIRISHYQERVLGVVELEPEAGAEAVVLLLVWPMQALVQGG